jgi:hypothetical protein
MGVNRFECRSCPFEAPLDKQWFEKTDMKQKEVDDVFGGKEEFANADSVASKLSRDLGGLLPDPIGTRANPRRTPRTEANGNLFYSSMPRRELQRGTCILLPAADSQCR